MNYGRIQLFQTVSETVDGAFTALGVNNCNEDRGVLASTVYVPSAEQDRPEQPVELPAFEELVDASGLEGWSEFSDLFGVIDLPEDALERLKSLSNRSDHVEAAKRDCVKQFLEQVFLPAIKHGDEIDLPWIAEALLVFKEDFHEAHPKDFPYGVSLASALDMELSLLALKSKARIFTSGREEEIDSLLIRANDVFGGCLDEYPALYLL